MRTITRHRPSGGRSRLGWPWGLQLSPYQSPPLLPPLMRETLWWSVFSTGSQLQRLVLTAPPLKKGAWRHSLLALSRQPPLPCPWLQRCHVAVLLLGHHGHPIHMTPGDTLIQLSWKREINMVVLSSVMVVGRGLSAPWRQQPHSQGGLRCSTIPRGVTRTMTTSPLLHSSWQESLQQLIAEALSAHPEGQGQARQAAPPAAQPRGVSDCQTDLNMPSVMALPCRQCPRGE